MSCLPDPEEDDGQKGRRSGTPKGNCGLDGGRRMSPELPSSSGMASKGTSVTRGGARLLIRVDCTGVGRLPAVLASLPALLLPACRFTLAPSSCTMPEMMSCTSGSDFRHERVPPPATSAAPGVKNALWS